VARFQERPYENTSYVSFAVSPSSSRPPVNSFSIFLPLSSLSLKHTQVSTHARTRTRTHTRVQYSLSSPPLSLSYSLTSPCSIPFISLFLILSPYYSDLFDFLLSLTTSKKRENVTIKVTTSLQGKKVRRKLVESSKIISVHDRSTKVWKIHSTASVCVPNRQRSSYDDPTSLNGGKL
jgi:hypothetical protein